MKQTEFVNFAPARRLFLEGETRRESGEDEREFEETSQPIPRYFRRRSSLHCRMEKLCSQAIRVSYDSVRGARTEPGGRSDSCLAVKGLPPAATKSTRSQGAEAFMESNAPHEAILLILRSMYDRHRLFLGVNRSHQPTLLARSRKRRTKRIVQGLAEVPRKSVLHP